VIEKGTTYEVFTDVPYTVERSALAPSPLMAAAPARIPEAAGSATVSVQTRVAPRPSHAAAPARIPEAAGSATVSAQTRVTPRPSPAAAPARIPEAAGSATVSVQTRVAGADIEVDGDFVGNTPTKLQLAAGQHNIVVRQGGASWQRPLMQVAAGSEITLQPSFAPPQSVIPESPAPMFAAQPQPTFFDKLKGGLYLEEALGANWLNTIGIVILVIGVALFLAYQLRQVGPAGKVL
jgi:hypothetical protein